MSGPNALYLGLPRSGSTWLFRHLRDHPDVYAPPAKDLYFFDRHYDRGLAWYDAQFRDAGAASIRIEFSHDYLFSAAAARRARHDLSDVRFVVGVREPIAYLESTLQNLRRNGASPTELTRLAESGRLVAGCLFDDFLRVWLDEFDRDDFFVYPFDHLAAAPHEVYEGVLGHLGLEHIVPDDISDAVNAGGAPRSARAAAMTRRAAHLARRAGGANVVGRIKSSPVIARTLYRPTREDEPVELDDRDALRALLRPSVHRLSDLVGIDLVTLWGYE